MHPHHTPHKPCTHITHHHAEAERFAQVIQIEFDCKIMEKEKQKKMSQICQRSLLLLASFPGLLTPVFVACSTSVLVLQATFAGEAWEQGYRLLPHEETV